MIVQSFFFFKVKVVEWLIVDLKPGRMEEEHSRQ